MDYGIYNPFYQKLTEKLPDLCMPDEVFQLVFPPRSAGWDNIQDGHMYDFLDSVTNLSSCYFAESDTRFSSIYRTYLNYLETSIPTVEPDSVKNCLDYLRTDCIEVFYEDGCPQLRPRLQLSGDLKTDISTWESNPPTPDFDESFLYLSPLAKYAYNIHIHGLGCYEIQRGSWYKEQLLSLLLMQPNDFFRSLYMVPMRILVIYGFTEKMNIQFYRTRKDVLKPAKHATSILGVSSKIINPNLGGKKNG